MCVSYVFVPCGRESDRIGGIYATSVGINTLNSMISLETVPIQFIADVA